MCDAVLGYLREHPRAMDSLEGIVQWWLPRHQVRVAVDSVVRALRELEEQGLVERVGEDARPLYRLRVRVGAS